MEELDKERDFDNVRHTDWFRRIRDEVHELQQIMAELQEDHSDEEDDENEEREMDIPEGASSTETGNEEEDVTRVTGDELTGELNDEDTDEMPSVDEW